MRPSLAAALLLGSLWVPASAGAAELKPPGWGPLTSERAANDVVPSGRKIRPGNRRS